MSHPRPDQLRLAPGAPRGRGSEALSPAAAACAVAPVMALVLALALALVLSLACGGHEPAAEMAEPSPVRAALATAERVEAPRQVELYGTVEAERTAAVSARVMAMVTAVHVQVGDAVRSGQLLLEIDPQAAQGQLDQARGALTQARAALALAERNYQRFQGLAEADAAAELELDMARMQHEQALGAVEQAEGAVAAAGAVAADSRVRAPFAGRVAGRMVEIGDLAAPGRPLLRLESAGARRLRLAVPESLALRPGLAVGDPVPVAIDARPDLGRLTGTVVERTPGADPASHSFEIKVALPVADLPSGAAGRAWVAGEPRAQVVVPAGAVLRRGGMSVVVVRDADGRAATRVVTLGGPVGEGRVEVLSGLAGGETVLLDLAAPPAPGALVEESSAEAGVGSTAAESPS